MSEVVQPGFFHKLRHTPLRDALRLRLTNSLDWKAIVARSALPSVVQDRLTAVLEQTRLWRSEKVEIAHELTAHFADGIDAGESAEQLIERFGDVRAVGKLIRRSKKRSRPMAWHIFNWLRWIFVAKVGLYILSAAYFFMGRPGRPVNHYVELNDHLRNLPAAETAWPDYRKAIIAIGNVDKDPELKTALSFNHREEDFEALKRWVGKHNDIVQLIHSGAAKSDLGFRLGPDGSANDKEIYPEIFVPPADEPNRDMLISTLLPHMRDCRRFAEILTADAQVAQDNKDVARWMRDIQDMIGISRQVGGRNDFLVGSLVSIAIRVQAVEQIGKALSTTPEMMSDEDLKQLAHRLGHERVAGELMSFASERLIFIDLLQRMYTDDGHGDGRITPAGLQMIGLLAQPGTSLFSSGTMAATYAAVPVVMPALASKRELLAEYDSFLVVSEQNLNQPLREAHWELYAQRLNDIRSSLLKSIRFMPIAIMVPALDRAQWTGERCIVRRQAVQVAIALELYKRRNGTYPANLEAMVPGLIPEMPLDPFDGQPLRYKLVDGKPLIYSIGRDRDDDGGRIHRDYKDVGADQPLQYFENNRAVSTFDNPNNLRNEGDWILYPPMPTTVQASGPATHPN